MSTDLKDNWGWEFNDREARELFLLSTPDERLKLLDDALEEFSSILPNQDRMTEEEIVLWT